jgi:multisubunit Na+/H+ antiporter MnhE subunit
MVTILVLTVNKVNEIDRRYYILGLSMVSVAFILFWIVFNRDMEEKIWISEILFAAGILLVLYRFIQSDNKQNDH